MNWKKIEGFERYEVSDEGDIKSTDMTIVTKNGQSFRKGKILKKTTGKDDYYQVHISTPGLDKNIPIHKLVAEAFIPNPDNLPMIDHIDGDKHNNHAWNLRWVDAKTNKNNPNTKANGQRKKGEYHHSDEAKMKIGLASKGRSSKFKGTHGRYTEETLKKMSENRKGIVGPKKCVLQYTLDGVLIKEWDSISEAIRQNNLVVGAANSSITCCCQGKHKTAYGYVWKYKNETEQKYE